MTVINNVIIKKGKIYLLSDGKRAKSQEMLSFKIGKTHLFQQKKYSGIVIIYFQCGIFLKVVEK